ncbi:MAG TPA: nucleotidyltransferase domain-containing protein [Candidatus Caccomorpha excrementavium]|nr:nucleotidyltransferase domain-containing protein [Candidatus Caccomorpha excrementavium]
MDFMELMNSAEYDFLRTHPRLGKRIMLLGVSGSYGYGTDREGSDVDFRGVTLNLPSDLIGLTRFEQYEDVRTDTVIYSFVKLIHLLLNCNPNTIEILGLDEDQYLICSPLGQKLLDHRELFLSKRAAASFGYYADAQLRRLQNAMARETLSQPSREEHILRSVSHALEDFNRRHASREKNRIRLYLDRAQTSGLETEIFLDASFEHYPLRNYNELMNTLNCVIRDYDKIGKRNHKKDENHLNKHAMHLIRLFMMGIDILEKAEIHTRRSGDDRTLLLRIRNGAYMKGGVLVPEFYEIVSDYEKRFEEAGKRSLLPDAPDMERVERFVEEVNQYAIREDCE